LSRFLFELTKLDKLVQEVVVDARRMRGDHLTAALGDLEVPAPGAFQQAGLGQIGFGPMIGRRVANLCRVPMDRKMG